MEGLPRVIFTSGSQGAKAKAREFQLVVENKCQLGGTSTEVVREEGEGRGSISFDRV